MAGAGAGAAGPGVAGGGMKRGGSCRGGKGGRGAREPAHMARRSVSAAPAAETERKALLYSALTAHSQQS